MSLSEGIIEMQRFKGYHKSPALKINPLVYREAWEKREPWATEAPGTHPVTNGGGGAPRQT